MAMPFPAEAGAIGVTQRRSQLGSAICVTVPLPAQFHNSKTSNKHRMASMSAHNRSDNFSGIDPSRRSFITRFAAAVFAAPAIATFALDGIARATPSHGNLDGPRHSHGNQSYCNQSLQNQTLHNQCVGNQHLHNQHMHNQHMNNQQLGNQSCSNQSDHNYGRQLDYDTSRWKHGECLPFDNHHHRRGHRSS
jgi:hypothetical protein